MDKFSQKGVSLYLAIAIMTALLAIVLGVTGILVNQLRMIRGMEDSVIAFYAADTGNEQALKDVYGGGSPAPTYNGFLDLNNSESQDADDPFYNVTVLTPGLNGCQASYYCIKSVGSYRETKRAIETNI